VLHDITIQSKSINQSIKTNHSVLSIIVEVKEGTLMIDKKRKMIFVVADVGRGCGEWTQATTDYYFYDDIDVDDDAGYHC